MCVCVHERERREEQGLNDSRSRSSNTKDDIPLCASQYIDEIEMVCSHNPKVPCVWCGAGVFMRGMWAGYAELVQSLIGKYDNLYISFTPEVHAYHSLLVFRFLLVSSSLLIT